MTNPAKAFFGRLFESDGRNGTAFMLHERESDKGATYAINDIVSDDDFLKQIFLELKAESVEEIRQKIVVFGAKLLKVPDPASTFKRRTRRFLSHVRKVGSIERSQTVYANAK